MRVPDSHVSCIHIINIFDFIFTEQRLRDRFPLRRQTYTDYICRNAGGFDATTYDVYGVRVLLGNVRPSLFAGLPSRVRGTYSAVCVCVEC